MATSSVNNNNPSNNTTNTNNSVNTKPVQSQTISCSTTTESTSNTTKDNIHLKYQNLKDIQVDKVISGETNKKPENNQSSIGVNSNSLVNSVGEISNQIDPHAQIYPSNNYSQIGYPRKPDTELKDTHLSNIVSKDVQNQQQTHQKPDTELKDTHLSNIVSKDVQNQQQTPQKPDTELKDTHLSNIVSKDVQNQQQTPQKPDTELKDTHLSNIVSKDVQNQKQNSMDENTKQFVDKVNDVVNNPEKYANPFTGKNGKGEQWDNWGLGLFNTLSEGKDEALRQKDAKAALQKLREEGRLRTDWDNLAPGSYILWDEGQWGKIGVFTGERNEKGEPLIVITGNGQGDFTGIKKIPLSEAEKILGAKPEGFALPQFGNNQTQPNQPNQINNQPNNEQNNPSQVNPNNSGQVSFPPDMDPAQREKIERYLAKANDALVNPQKYRNPGNKMTGNGEQWDLWCLGFVNEMGDKKDPSLQQDSAKLAYYDLLNKGRIRTDWDQMVPGSYILWDEGEWGHIAIYTGEKNEKGEPIVITTTGWGGVSGIHKMPLSQLIQMMGAKPDGWAIPKL